MDQAKLSKDAPSLVDVTPPIEARRRARDVLFYGGLLPVTVALGLALHLHVDLAPLLAAAIVLPTAVCLLLAHKLQRRAQNIRLLEGELAELRRVSPVTRQGRDQRLDSGASASPVRTSAGMPAGGRMAPNLAGPTPRGSTQHGVGHGSPPPSVLSRELGPLPAGGRGTPSPPPAPNTSIKVRSDLSPPALPGGPALSQTTQPASGAQVTEALMGTYWGHRPGVSPEPTLQPPLVSPVAQFAAQLSGQKPASPGSDAETRRPGPPVGPVVPAADLGPGPDERELETMQNLIQQLAVQLNAPKPEHAVEAASLAEPASAKLERVVHEPAKSETARSDAAKSEIPKSETATAEPATASSKPESGKPETAAPESPDADVRQPTDGDDGAVAQSVAALRIAASTMRQPPEVRSHAGSAGGSPAASSTEKNAEASATARFADRSPAVPPPLPPTAVIESRYGKLARVTEAVAADRIDVYLDPILGLGDRKARLFEVSVRLLSSTGEVLDAAEIREIASGTGLLARIDAAKLARSARVAARLRARGTNASLYSNLASESLADDVFLDTFEDSIAAEADLPKRLVLSFTQADVRAFNDVHWETVATMAEIGLRFALEDVADLDMDFERLKSSGFEFVKLDAPVFLEGLPAPDGAIPAADLCRHLSGHGFALIVGAIEDEMDLAKVLGFGVLFGQGTIFGGPRAVQLDPPQPQTAAA